MLKKIKNLAFKYKLYIKYLISGGTAALVNLGSLYVLTDIFHLWYLISAIVAFFISFFISFNLQKRWTFRNGDSQVGRQMMIYFLIAGTNLIINVGALYVLVDIIGLWYMLAQVLIYGFLAIASFMLYKLVVFKIVPQTGNKKILIATGIFPPDIGGPATYVETLLNELPKSGYEVRVITYADEKLPAYDGREIRNYNLEIFKICRRQNILLRYFKYFFQTFKLLSWADIVYIQDPISAGIPASWACRLYGKKYLLKIVGDYAWEQGRQKYGVKENLDEFQDKKYSKPVERIRYLQKFTAGGALKIIVPSEYLKKIVMSWGIDVNKIKVIYNSVRPAQAMKGKTELRQELELGGDIIVSVGRLVPWKGFDTLIDLMPELIKTNPNFKLLIIGQGPDMENLKLKILNLKLEKQVILLGALEQEKLWEYMKASDFFVLNTGYEGLPHIVIEAMYLGLPVVTTYSGGNTEVVHPGNNGILVEYNNRDQIRNAILKLWKDVEARDVLVENAKRDLSRFGVERMIEGLKTEIA